MESTSPTPSQPPARELQVRVPSSPPLRRSSRPPPGSTLEMPAMEDIRRQPIPKTRREMELEVIGRIVARLMPNLSEPDRLMLYKAAGDAEKVAGTSPKAEFIFGLKSNDLFMLVLETYKEMEK